MGILVALVTSAALLPLELSVRRTRATHEEAKPQQELLLEKE